MSKTIARPRLLAALLVLEILSLAITESGLSSSKKRKLNNLLGYNSRFKNYKSYQLNN